MMRSASVDAPLFDVLEHGRGDRRAAGRQHGAGAVHGLRRRCVAVAVRRSPCSFSSPLARTVAPAFTMSPMAARIRQRAGGAGDERFIGLVICPASRTPASPICPAGWWCWRGRRKHHRRRPVPAPECGGRLPSLRLAEAAGLPGQQQSGAGEWETGCERRRDHAQAVQHDAERVVRHLVWRRGQHR